jgi:AraC-like DNA-binding protein
MYRERPSSVVPGATLWVSVPERDGVDRVVPDGCMDLIWYEGALHIAGPDTGPFFASTSAGEAYVGLRFAPGTAPGPLGLPADEARDQRVPLEAVWTPPDVRRAHEAVGTATDAEGMLDALEAIAARRLAASDPVDPLLGALVRRLRGSAPITDIADEFGLSQRQLLRRCVPAFGYGPKVLARILRAQRALAMAHTGVGWADVAAAVGYADQAHLSREIRALTGASPRELAADSGG